MWDFYKKGKERAKKRLKRMEELEEKIWEQLDAKPSTTVNDVKNNEQASRSEKLINSELAILRLLQAEDRLTNNLRISVLSFAGGGVVVGIAGFLIKYFSK